MQHIHHDVTCVCVNNAGNLAGGEETMHSIFDGLASNFVRISLNVDSSVSADTEAAAPMIIQLVV